MFSFQTQRRFHTGHWHTQNQEFLGTNLNSLLDWIGQTKCCFVLDAKGGLAKK